MHIAEGLLPWEHALFWTLACTPFLAVGVQQTRCILRDGSSEERALVSMAGALVFAVTLFPVPVPVVGISSHLCATPLFALLLGIRGLVLPTLLVLTLQALFFAHGGLTTLGANTFTLGVIGPVVAVGLARGLSALKVPAAIGIGVACMLADVAVYVADAAMVGFALAGQKPFGHWFSVLLLSFAPVQLPLAVLEGVLSSLLVRALARRRPELAPAWLGLSSRPASLRSASFLLLCLLPLLSFSLPVRAQSAYPGLDEAIMSATAERAGRVTAKPLIDLEGTELGRAVLMLGAFSAGLIVGLSWQRLGSPSRRSHAP